MKNSLVLLTAAAGVLTMGSAYAAEEAASTEQKAENEKCYGVVKAGKNDCAGGAHSCAGHATADSDANEWVFLPKGACERIVGGSLTPKTGS